MTLLRRRVGAVDPGRVLRRRRSPLQLALGGALIALILVVEVLILRAYGEVSRTTASFGRATFLTGNLVNVQRELVLFNVEVERLPSHHDLDAVRVRRGLVGNQFTLFLIKGQGDPLVEAAAGPVRRELQIVDRALARAAAKPTPARFRAEVAVMRPPLRRAEVHLKQLYDQEEQALFGAVGDALAARARSERLLVGLSALVLVVGAVLALSLRQRVRSDFARAWRKLTAEVDERKAAEAALRASEERFRSLVQNSSDVITILDADGAVRYHSESVRRVFGYDPEELLHGDFRMRVHPDDRDRVAGFIAEAALRPGVTAAATWRVRHRDGTWLHTETVAANLLDDPNVQGLVLNTRDVSERKELEDQLVHQAFHDGLTGLANRSLFTERVEQALGAIGPTDVGVLFVDLDDFKHVNDSLGHAAGDQLLVAAAKRLKHSLRRTDTAARFGGDEFAILLDRVASPEAAAGVATRVIEGLHQPFGLNGRAIPIKASIGVAVGKRGVDDADGLLRNAEAMYAAKAGGKDRFEVFRPDMHAGMLQRLELEAELRHAADRGELVLHYQPIVELSSGRITSVEALVRWQHPTRGLLGPLAFIPLAEEQGIIGPIGRWVLSEACRQARRWQDRFQGVPPLTMHVNLSGRQLQQPGVIAEVAQALEASAMEPGLLTLEITETVLMADTDTVSQRLQDLKQLGVRLAIDDFGTGYSSLSYLRRFPIDMLKIDKAFVDGIGGAGLAVLGCHDGQGYHFSRPLAREAMDELLERTLQPGGFLLAATGAVAT